MRILLSGLIVIFAAQLSAQTVLNVNDTTQADEFLLIRYEVGHGTPAASVQIDVDITTTNANGLTVQVYQDWDTFVAGFGGLTQNDIPGAGTVNFTANTTARTGVHPVIVMIGSEGTFSAATDFSGTITFSANGVTSPGEGKHQFYVDGLYHSIQDVFADYTTYNAAGTTDYIITIDAGPTSQTFDVRILTQALGATEVSLLNTTSGTVVLDTYPDSGGSALGQAAYPITASGQVELRLRCTGGTAGTYFLGRYFLPSTVTVVSVSTDTPGNTPDNNDNDDGGDDEGCTSGDNRSIGMALALMALALITLWRYKFNTCCR